MAALLCVLHVRVCLWTRGFSRAWKRTNSVTGYPCKYSTLSITHQRCQTQSKSTSWKLVTIFDKNVDMVLFVRTLCGHSCCYVGFVTGSKYARLYMSFFVSTLLAEKTILSWYLLCQSVSPDHSGILYVFPTHIIVNFFINFTCTSSAKARYSLFVLKVSLNSNQSVNVNLQIIILSHKGVSALGS